MIICVFLLTVWIVNNFCRKFLQVKVISGTFEYFCMDIYGRFCSFTRTYTLFYT